MIAQANPHPSNPNKRKRTALFLSEWWKKGMIGFN